MTDSNLRRSLAVGAFAIVGASLAFLTGARFGSTLDHHTRSISVARVPVQDMRGPAPEAPQEAAPPTEVAHR